MIPIKEAAAVGLLQWICRTRPELNDLAMVDEASFLDLVSQYERSHGRPFDLFASDGGLVARWRDAFGYLAPRPRRDQYIHFAFEWDRKTGDQLAHDPQWIEEDALARYKRVPFKAMFFLTSEDRLAHGYIADHWKALDGMSGDYCDIYVCGMTINADLDAYRQMQSLTNIPGVKSLTPDDLPCLLFWSGDECAKLSLRVADHNPGDLTARLRACFGEIWKAKSYAQNDKDDDSFFRLISRKLLTRSPPEATIRTVLGAITEISQRSSLRKKNSALVPVMQFDVFISYKRRMRRQVEELSKTLADTKIKVWFDKAIEPGTQFHAEIALNLRRSKTVLIAWSPDAFPKGGDTNGWVVGEALIGRSRSASGDGGFVPTLFERTDLDPPFNTDHLIDLTKWFEKSHSERTSCEEWKALCGAIYPWTGDPRQRMHMSG